jgi:energy-coupling factor transporter transmembrane protein EcfT
MFGLNIFLAESPLGQWGTGMRVMDAGIKALRLVSTAVAFFVLTLGTAPRDLARDLERLRFPLWFTETLAITLRFLPVFEINALMFKRAVAIRFAGHDGRDFVLRIPRYAKDAMVGILIMALSQANATAQSLSLRRFSAASARLHYSCASKPLASWLLYSLGVLNLTLVMILFTR